MEAATAARSGGRLSRPAYSCIRCSDRKVKCDRQNPCSGCTKHNVICEFRPLPPRKPVKRAKDEKVLRERLRRYEQLLAEQGINPNAPLTPESLPGRTPSHDAETAAQQYPKRTSSTGTETTLGLPPPESVSSGTVRSITKTQLLQQGGLSRFVDNPLWTRVIEEIHDPEDAFDDAEGQEESDEDLLEYENDFDFVLGIKSDVKCPHPSSGHIDQLWQAFVDNVDPITKVVHVPTLRPAVQKASTDMASVPRSFEALMFSIYSMAVLSLTNDECLDRFGEERKVLLSRYISATKVALARTNLMGTLSLVVLQALSLHIFSIRDIYDPRTVWTLTGVALRIAEGMGLERDGSTFGLPPFEAEIRRRIWWQLKMHDFRTTELSGLAKAKALNKDENAPEPPININDDQLYPGMTSLPEESNTPKDMIFVSLRSQLGHFAQKLNAKKLKEGMSSNWWNDAASTADMAEKEAGLKGVEEMFELKFLRYCDPSDPLQFMSMLFARMAMNHGRFLVHHPRRWPSPEETPESERQFVWNTSIRLLEQVDMTQTSRILQRYAWNTSYFFPWPPFIHVVDTLRAQPLMPEAGKAWQLIESLFDASPHLHTNTRKPIYIVVGNLTLKAYHARSMALANSGRNVPKTPDFITKLQQQRAGAKARREARHAKKRQSGIEKAQIQTNPTTATSTKSEVMSSQGSSDAYMSMQNLNLQPTTEQPNVNMDIDPFWFTNGFSNNFVDTSNSFANDADFILASPDTSLENIITGDHINWQQWDAALANMNMNIYH